MRRARKIVLIVIGLIFLAISAWWTLFVPYTPEKLYAPIPANAVLVSSHEQLSSRWGDFTANPFTLSLFSSLGVKPEDLRELETDPEGRKWFHLLAGRNVALAHVPALGMNGRPAWIATSWLGGRSQRLRWQLQSGGLRDFKQISPYAGRPYWAVRTKYIDPSTTLSISLVEGMLIACISDHPDNMRIILDTYDGLLPSITAWSSFRNVMLNPSASPTPDRGWIAAGTLGARIDPRLTHFAYSFDRVTATHLSGRLSCNVADRALTETNVVADTAGLDRLLGDLPIGLGVFGKKTALAFFDNFREIAWLQSLRNAVDRQSGQTAFVAILGDDYSGRIFGLKMPTLLAGIRTRDAAASTTNMFQILDRLNALQRWGLIPRTEEAGESRVYAVESTTGGAYNKLAEDEQLAFTVCGGWLLWCSNVEALSKLAARFERMESLDEAANARWRSPVSSNRDPAFVWFDLDRGGQTLRLAVATYSLKMLLDDPRGSQPLRQQLNEVKAWIDTLAPMNVCRIGLGAEGGDAVVRFDIGK